MSYSQLKYNDFIGQSNIRIAQVGCFLTAFSNLLARFGNDIAPPALNKLILERGGFYSNGFGQLTLLAWSSVTQADPSVVISRRGSGAPTSNNSIVKFVFSGGLTHFSLVHDAKAGLIVDSWDGEIKSWHNYGGPVEFAEYVDNTPNLAPQPVMAVPTSRAYDGKAITTLLGDGLSVLAQEAGYEDAGSEVRWEAIARLNGSDDWFTFNKNLQPGQRIIVRGDAPIENTPQSTGAYKEFVTIQPGDGLAVAARTAGYADWDTEGRWVAVASLNGSNNWQYFNDHLVAGQVIRTAEAKAPEAPTPQPEPTPTPQVEEPKTSGPVDIPVRKAEPVTPSWQDTFESNPQRYIATRSIEVHDIEGIRPSIQLVKNQSVNGAGIFRKDGAIYVRTVKNASENKWYGVPMSALQPVGAGKYVGRIAERPVDGVELSSELKEAMTRLTSRERLVELVARLTGFFGGIVKRVKRK